MAADVIPLFRDPKAEADALYLKGVAVDEENPEEGARLYRLALVFDPEHALAWVNLGVLEEREIRLDEARWCFLKALVADHEQPEALYNLGYLALEEGDAHLALPLLRASVEADPNFAGAHFNLALALKNLDRTWEAKPHWLAYLKLAGENDSYASLARHHLRG